MNIIDFRFRPNTPETIDGIKNSSMFKAACKVIGFDQRKSQPLPIIVKELDERGVSLCVITGRDCESTYNSSSNNESVLAYVKAFPKKFIGFWGVDPHKGMAAVAELENAVNSFAIRGASIDPYLAHLRPDAARYYPIYAKCCELDIPIVITTAPPPQVNGAIIEYSDPRYVDVVARDFPSLRIVMSHGGYPFVMEAIYVAMRNANVYIDCSEYEEAPMGDIYSKAMNGMICDKTVFASAHPFIEQSHALEVYKKMPLSDENRRKIMFENAKKILKL